MVTSGLLQRSGTEVAPFFQATDEETPALQMSLVFVNRPDT
jgi:hypothetical protein